MSNSSAQAPGLEVTDPEHFANIKQRLERYFAQHLPSAVAAGVELTSYSDDLLVLSAPLAANHNDHGDAFGGSLYNIALLSGWSVLYLECSKHFARPHIVSRDATMRYRHPVNDQTIFVSCKVPSKRQWEGFFAHYEKTGKTTISLSTSIGNDNGNAARLEAVYVLLEDKSL